MPASPLLRLVRLAFVGGLFLAAAAAIPTGGVLQTAAGGAGGADQDAALLERFPRDDRQLVARGRAARFVGQRVGSLELRSIDGGGELPLTDVGKPVVMLFVEPGCTPCAEEIGKLAVMSTVYVEELYVAVAGPEGTADELEQMLLYQAGEGLILGGEDFDGAVAKRLGVRRRPTIVIASADGVVDAVWSEPVPLNLLYRFLSNAYGLERGA